MSWCKSIGSNFYKAKISHFVRNDINLEWIHSSSENN